MAATTPSQPTTATLLAEVGWTTAETDTAIAARAIQPLVRPWCIPGFRKTFKVLR